MGRQPKDQVLFDVHNHCVNLNLRDIYVHSIFGKDDETEPGVDYRQATTFIKNLHLLDVSPHKPILVHLHSVGGCWYNGMAMFNSIQFATSYITILAYSQASSMSGILLQSAALRVMMPDCHYMIHYGWDNTGENHPFAVKSQADFGMKACKRMIQIFAERAINGPFFAKKSTTVQTVAKFFDKKLKEKGDWYLNAEEAVWYGICDKILGEKGYESIDNLRQRIVGMSHDR